MRIIRAAAERTRLVLSDAVVASDAVRASRSRLHVSPSGSLSRPRRSGGMIRRIDWPIASFALYPKIAFRRAKRKNERVEAVSVSAARSGLAPIDTISHADPAPCMNVPMSYTTSARSS